MLIKDIKTNKLYKTKQGLLFVTNFQDNNVLFYGKNNSGSYPFALFADIALKECSKIQTFFFNFFREFDNIDKNKELTKKIWKKRWI